MGFITTNGTDVYTHTYLNNSNLLDTISYPGDLKVDYAYEPNRDLITQVINSHNSSTIISQYDYTYDAAGRRSDVDLSGTAFTSSDTITYNYNDRGEVIGANAASNTSYNFGFAFDNIGNRNTSTSNETGSNVTTSYTVNNINQYTSVSNPLQSLTYDDDGNMLTLALTSGSWTNTYNAENRIISQEKMMPE